MLPPGLPPTDSRRWRVLRPSHHRAPLAQATLQMGFGCRDARKIARKRRTTLTKVGRVAVACQSRVPSAGFGSPSVGTFASYFAKRPRIWWRDDRNPETPDAVGLLADLYRPSAQSR